MSTSDNTSDKLNTHEAYMFKCIELALRAKAQGESPVGSIIVQGTEIIGQGIESNKMHNDVTFHAEIEAIRRATENLKSQDLSSCIMYTTHEPCIMCSYVIRQTKIKAVVIGLTNKEVGGLSSKYALLADSSIAKWDKSPTIITGILEEECRKLAN
ncbi:nucleoside deaminase [Danxiaibacter flavus]|uniref:Nucleoside deaminase n=1 Tax=Danxiaibacter flavus TaxID=3049108 RepID=A0ABV3ZIR3_9BACT|nr:nucleoside deaminase [Chitinophagaceae bacterium DXS]